MKQLSLLARARKIQETVTQHYEKECRAKCLRAVWKHHVEEEFGINYHTFLLGWSGSDGSVSLLPPDEGVKVASDTLSTPPIVIRSFLSGA